MRFILATLCLTSCALPPTSPKDIPDWIRDEWAIGQERVALAMGDIPAIYDILLEMFYLEEMPGVFKCNGVWANGCYSSGKHRIRYNKDTPSVIRHEAGHAILHRLQMVCWHNFEHTEFPYGCR